MFTNFHTQNVINQSNKAPCKHRAVIKLSSTHRTSTIYKFIQINIQMYPQCMKMIYSYCWNCRMTAWDQYIIS